MGGPAYVSVIGPGDAHPSELIVAERVGALLARTGVVVVSGGLGGVMEASCRGAVRAGGTTVGLLPGSDRSQANAFLTVSVPTGLGEGRNALVVSAGDGIIAVGRGWGTLSEIALAMRGDRPLASLASWRIPGSDEDNVLPEFDDPEDAVAWIMRSIQSRRGQGD